MHGSFHPSTARGRGRRWTQPARLSGGQERQRPQRDLRHDALAARVPLQPKRPVRALQLFCVPQKLRACTPLARHRSLGLRQPRRERRAPAYRATAACTAAARARPGRVRGGGVALACAALVDIGVGVGVGVGVYVSVDLNKTISYYIIL